MAGPLDAVMGIGKYMRRKLRFGRYTYICVILALSFVSVLTLGILQTNLKTNKEQIDNIRKWRDITRGDNLDKPLVELSHNSIDQHKEPEIVYNRNLKENRNTVRKGEWNAIAGRRQLGYEKVNHADENQLLFENNLKLLRNKERKLSDNNVGLKRHVKEMNVIEGQDKKQGHSDKETVDNSDKEENLGPVKKQQIDDFNMEHRNDNEKEKEQQSLIDSLSDLLAKLEDKGLDADLQQKIFADADPNDGEHLPSFDPKLYPQAVDIPQLVNEFAQSGVLPEHAINKWIYQPIINPSHVCGLQSDVFLLFIVKTKPDNFEKRKSIRKTWADQGRFPNIRTVFSVGVPKLSHNMKKLKIESVKYKDILLMDYMDTYYNLTLKTTSGINWAVAHCSMAEFVVSVDDDMYIATDLLIQHLQGIPQAEAERLYLGSVYKDTLPVRKETSNVYIQKWVISEKAYSFSTYPDYVFGGCIIMSMRTVIEMYTIIPYTKTIVMEDVYVGILASRLGIVPIHTDLVDVYVTYSNSEQFKTLIASHYYKTSQMLRKAWECHLSIVNKDVEKAVFCIYLKEELETLREQVDSILYWIELSNDAI